MDSLMLYWKRETAPNTEQYTVASKRRRKNQECMAKEELSVCND